VPLAGAAYYRIQIANNELFNGAITATTNWPRARQQHDKSAGDTAAKVALPKWVPF
jgi:hypothetical protein